MRIKRLAQGISIPILLAAVGAGHFVNVKTHDSRRRRTTTATLRHDHKINNTMVIATIADQLLCTGRHFSAFIVKSKMRTVLFVDRSNGIGSRTFTPFFSYFSLNFLLTQT